MPRDHNRPQHETLDLAVAVLRATGSEHADDPIIFLTGGPGYSGVERVFAQERSRVLAYWREKRDVVLLDQRGSGATLPDLDCPEYDKQFLDAWSAPLSVDEEVSSLVAAMKVCHDRLVGVGVDLKVYTSAQSALDVAAVMRALGYLEYNLYGVSHGGRLALTVMRDAPEGVRSVVLDSPAPLTSQPSFPHGAEMAFKTLEAACDADAECAATYPKLERAVIELAAELDQKPVSIDSTQRDAPPLIVNGPRALYTLFGGMYDRSSISWVPLAITQLSQGTPGVFANFLNGFVDEIARARYAEGMAYSNLCSEQYPFIAPTHDQDLASASQPYRSLDQLAFQTQGVCAFWPVRPPEPKENEAVHSDIPTLILSGSLDPVTPRPLAAQIAETLSSSQQLSFEGIAHGVVRTITGEADGPRCAQRLTQAFFDAPRDPVDASCQRDIPPIAWGGTR